MPSALVHRCLDAFGAGRVVGLMPLALVDCGLDVWRAVSTLSRGKSPNFVRAPLHGRVRNLSQM